MLLGLDLAVMNLAFYESVHLLGLGIAATIEFLGPLAVALLMSRRLLDVGRSADRFGHPYSPLQPGEIDQGQFDRVLEVLGVDTCAALVSRETWQRVGLLDERLEGHGDVDLGWRLYLLRALFAMVLVLARLNVATLVFARTAARETSRPIAIPASRPPRWAATGSRSSTAAADPAGGSSHAADLGRHDEGGAGGGLHGVHRGVRRDLL